MSLHRGRARARSRDIIALSAYHAVVVACVASIAIRPSSHIRAQHCAALDLLRIRALHRMLRASMD